MKDTKDAGVIQIDITNRCEHSCPNCTHLIKHSPIWDMPLATFRKAVDSLVGWPKMVGIIGGNPLLHPQVDEFVDYMSSKISKEKMGLWTSNFYDKEKLAKETFGFINYNTHVTRVFHQPVLCASKDLVKDPVVRNNLINSCWVAEKWSPSITPKGCYRCEVMGALDMALNYNLGLPIEPEWYNKPLADFQKQISTFCQICSVCIPLKGRRDKEGKDDISQSNLELFKESPRIRSGQYVLFEGNFENIKKWDPETYRRDHLKQLNGLKQFCNRRYNQIFKREKHQTEETKATRKKTE